MSGAAAIGRLNDAYLARLEKIAGLIDTGVLTAKEGKQFTVGAKKAWKQVVALHNMSAAPLSQVSVEEDDHESCDVNGDEEEYDVERSPLGNQHVPAKARASYSHIQPATNRAKQGKQCKQGWPVNTYGVNLTAEAYPSMAAGRHSVAAAFQAHTLYAGVSPHDFTRRSRHHPSGAGAGGRHYVDWEVIDASKGEVYGCRCHQPSPPHPSPLTRYPSPRLSPSPSPSTINPLPVSVV